LDLDKNDRDVHRIFIDPTGTHTIISMKSESVLYWHRSWKKSKRLVRIRGLLIQSLAWNTDTIMIKKDELNLNGETTGLSLIGTDDGRIYEFCIINANSEDMFGLSNEARWRQVMQLFDKEGAQGIYMSRFSNEPLKYYIMAVTLHRLYQFIGYINVPKLKVYETEPSLSDALLPTFQDLFAAYEHSPYFQEIPGNLEVSELSIARLPMHHERDTSGFVWITGKLDVHFQV
jgi:vacuolar protein sorting-associated protein 18